jgi:hypothetical protein
MHYLPILLFILVGACRSAKPSGAFNEYTPPPAPDYAQSNNWVAHPDRQDMADEVPCPNLQNRQSSAAADVFFLYPTTYTGAIQSQKNWNADVGDAATNLKTEEGTIRFQASIFNEAGRIYAPRYRQAHLDAFFTRDKASAKQALDLAYTDVKAAFEYYLKHWNHGRPIIIAGHSQGAFHAMHLLRDYVENQPLQQQLVVAYLAGWPVDSGFFQQIEPCETPEQTGCFCSWRTWERKNGLKVFANAPTSVICTNPINWRNTEGAYAPAGDNKGGVVRPFCAIYPELTDAQVYHGYVLCRKPHFQGSALVRIHNYHPGDFNLYYMNVRENAYLRVMQFLKK